MGEWSKKVGEAGESVVKEFLQLIGWGTAQSGVPLSCAWPEKHKSANSARQTHGIDYFYSYKSPLIDELLQNVVISVKFTADPYPASPGTLFKGHFLDLTSTLECFKNSALRRDAQTGRSGIRDTQDVGVLFWLSNSANSYDDVISRLQTLHIPDGNIFRTVYLVDNKRIAFIYDGLMFARSKFPGATIEFYYHETGRNMNPLINSKRGLLLPVECITSNVLAFRVAPANSREVFLMLLLNDSFDEDSLRRMIGLAQSLSGNWTSRIYIGFSNFNLLEHANSVQKVKTGFEDKAMTQDLEVVSYSSDFRNLNS